MYPVHPAKDYFDIISSEQRRLISITRRDVRRVKDGPVLADIPCCV